MEIIRFADIHPEPWRNGGGVTRELASHPKAASAQDGAWDWRVSIADVSKAGEFSTFPGMERVITIIDGELLLLTVDGAEHPLEKYRPFRFSGEAASSAALPTGDIRDLNVIARTGAFKGYTSIVEISKKRAHPVFEGQLAILLEGKATVAPGAVVEKESDGGEAATSEAAPSTGEPVELSRYDAVVGSDTRSPEISGRGFIAVISIDHVEPVHA
ncbi:environmental stress-induced protein Ves [Pseudarthrobacter sp. PvP004]|uniref:HutD/Ves family protein n=1 Tax=Pseudarthrobacter sp. PvP004 TaxID=2817850 RepID=UPI001AE7A597|nr:HutD family protein [Pseudarthrobacter sp. PvP004]MBP2268939.1 environmental stress-induced protein Ves [Pseudarthrobacter sp. PvP004]